MKINQLARPWVRVGACYGPVPTVYAVSLEGGVIRCRSRHVTFRIACMINLIGGTMFPMWGEQITAARIGNGIPHHLRLQSLRGSRSIAHFLCLRAVGFRAI